MADCRASATALIDAYNAKNFDAMRALMAPDVDFAHFNRDFAFRDRDTLLEILRKFANQLMPDRRFQQAERVTVAGNLVIREGYYTGTPTVDLPGFAEMGGKVRLKFCSVLRFDDTGMLVEWKDYG